MIVHNSELCEKANRVKLNIYNFGYATVNSEWNGLVQTPSFSRLYYVVGGKAYIEYNGVKMSLLPGNWYLIPAGLSFSFGCDNEMEHLYFHITLTAIEELDLLNKFDRPVFIQDNSKPHIFCMAYLEDKSLIASLAVKEKIYNTLIKFMEKNCVKLEMIEFSQCVQAAIEFINNNLFEKLDLATIAKHTYVSKCTLTNKFKSELKITIHEYIQRQKMFEAEKMLRNSKVSIAEISQRLGFSEQFYFSRCFSQKFGVSPREYRKSKIN